MEAYATSTGGGGSASTVELLKLGTSNRVDGAFGGHSLSTIIKNDKNGHRSTNQSRQRLTFNYQPSINFGFGMWLANFDLHHYHKLQIGH